MYNNSALWQAKVLEFWSPAPLPEGDPGKDAAAPVELQQPAKEEAEFSSDSSVGSEPEVEITGASGSPTSGALRRKTRCAVRKIQLSKAGSVAAQQAVKSSTRRGTSKVRGASAPPATTEVGSVLTGRKVEEDAAQSLDQLHGEMASPHAGSGTPPTAPLRLKFPLRCSGG